MLVRAAGSVAVAAASGRFDDQLRAGPVDVCWALQQVGTVDAEPVQSGLDRAGVLTKTACDGWSRCGRVLGASGGLAAGVCYGPGSRQPATSAASAPLVSVSTSSSVDTGCLLRHSVASDLAGRGVRDVGGR